MRIYFDESGQSGCVLQKEDILNFQKQPTFAVGAVVVRDSVAADKLVEKYNNFKEKFKIDGEIKGSNLLTKAHNDELDYFLKNVLDRYHFFFILYDKRFYISTLLLLSLIGFEYQYSMPEHFYQQATFLSLQNDDFFINYLKYVQNPGVAEFTKYLRFLVDYEYAHDEGTENAVVTMAQRILDEGGEDLFFDDFMTFGWYDNPRVTNLINLNAVSELIYFVKSQVVEGNKEIIYIHDHITEFEDTFQRELRDHGIDMTFADSKQEVMLQIADNAVSILRHAYDKCMLHHRDREQWYEENEWDMKLISRVVRKASIPHIKFTVPLCDWAASVSTAIMFSPKYPKKYRNNIHFNYYYQRILGDAFDAISDRNRSMEEIIEFLEK